MKSRMRFPSLKTCVVIALVSMLLAGGCVFLWVQAIERDYKKTMVQYQEGRQNLARELGVKDINDYLYPGSFPVGYFDVQLSDGMPITVVHQIVHGYVQAYRCLSNREVYDFYDVERPLRLRIQVGYDEQLHYIQRKSLKVDDPNSDPIDMTNCARGRLAE